MKSSLKAFTLIEVIIVIGVLTILIGIGLPITLDFMRNYNLKNERDTLVTLLEFSRNQSLTNVDQSSHGLQIDNNKFTSFTGLSYSQRDTQYDLVYPKTDSIPISGGDEIVFTPLTGRTNQATFTVSDGAKQLLVTVNPEGTIDW